MHGLWAQVLRRAEGALQLLDVSAQLPHLKRMSGLSRWQVKGGGQGMLSSWQEAEQAGQVGKPTCQKTVSCFTQPAGADLLCTATFRQP